MDNHKIMFKTIKDQLRLIPSIKSEMISEGYSDSFVNNIAKLAETDQGVFDLMQFWYDAEDDIEKEFIIQDMERSIVDHYKC